MSSTYALTTAAAVQQFLRMQETEDAALIGRCVDAASAMIETHCGRQFVARDRSEWMRDIRESTLRLRHYPIISLTRLAIGARNVISLRCTDTSAAYAVASVSATGLTLVVGNGSAAQTILWSTATTLQAVVAALNALPTFTASLVSAGAATWPSTELMPCQAMNCRVTQYLSAPTEPSAAFDLYDSDAGLITLLDGAPGDDVFLQYRAGYEAVPADLAQIAVELASQLYQSREVDGNLASENIEGQNAAYKTQVQLSDDLAARLRLWRTID
jgi:hypothetical protein